MRRLGPRLAVVIVTYNSAAVVGDLLDDLAHVSVELSDVCRSVAIVVVDNGSADDSLSILRRSSGITLVESTNTGYAAGLNLGLRHAGDYDIALLLNPDLRVLPDAVPRLIEALSATSIGVSVPRVLNPEGGLEYSLRREPTLPRALGLNFTRISFFSEYLNVDDAYSQPQIVDWALGAAMMLRRECYDAVGGWDESFFLYSEETDFCLRARDAGWLTSYVPGAVVVHAGGGSGRNDLTHVMQIVNRVRCYSRRHSIPAGYLYWAATVLSETSWILRGHPQSRASVRALLLRESRPPQLDLSARLLPR